MQKILEEDKPTIEKNTCLFRVDKKRKYYGKIFKKQENKAWEYVMSYINMSNNGERTT